MKAKDAKKLVCACRMRQGRKMIICGRKATITFRVETTKGPEYLTFCRGHLSTAEKALHAIKECTK